MHLVSHKRIPGSGSWLCEKQGDVLAERASDNVGNTRASSRCCCGVTVRVVLWLRERGETGKSREEQGVRGYKGREMGETGKQTSVFRR